MTVETHSPETMSKSRQEQLEQVTSQSPSTSYKLNQNWSLDPSLLVSQNLNSADSTRSASHKMTLRRRGIQCQSSTSTSSPLSATKHETILPLNSTFLPKEEVRDTSAIKTTKREDKRDKNDNSDECNRHQASRNDKIFSITTYVALFIAFATLFGILCLCVCNRASLLVSAQYSNYALGPNGNNHHHHNNGRSAQHLMNRQAGTSQPAAVAQQADIGSTNHRDVSPDAHSLEQNDERRWAKKSSIDRYDSGEQIRPPLLRQPTTLAPLKSTAQQASVNNQHNLQEAASQDSYLSPDDREQLLKSQDSHYEGKNVDPSSSASYDGFQNDRGDGYEKAPNRWSQPLQDAPEPPISAKQASLEYQSSRPEPLTASRAINQGDNDDGDYEEDSIEPVKKSKSNMVPEMRRGVASPSYNHKRPSLASQAAAKLAANEAAANEEGDPNDDYGGGSDDSHFSRKSHQQDRVPGLNLAASHNQQLNRGLDSGGGGYAPEGPQRGGGNSEQGPQDEAHGFGPGPNEAYMAEKAEVGKDQDGDESLYAPAEGSPGESNGLSEEAGEGAFDRRSMNPYSTNKASSSSYGSSPMNYGQPVRAQANLIDNGEPEGDPEDGNDASEESGSSFAPSLKTEVKSRAVPHNAPTDRNYNNNNNNNLSPKTSASALAPQSATYSHPSSPIITVPSPMLAGSKPPLPAVNPQPFYRQQVHNGNRQAQNQLVNNNAPASQPANYQRASLNAPYNPQNNPSHAGKYFIN